MRNLHNSLDYGKPVRRPARNPRWIVKECRACGGHPIPFDVGGWECVHAFALQGWSVLRDGDAVRIWFGDQQEGSA